ncbi:glutamate--cysteine ligase, partial [Rhizobium ruizarguesonis]
MARDTTDQTPLSSFQDLTDYIAAGNKPRERFRIGTEHDKFSFFRADNSPVPYFGDASISALLTGLQKKSGCEPITYGGNIIGLAEQHGMGSIEIAPM